ncbi:hypothetical protein PF005_g9927 [Phytophthora fragariae]|uniref:Nucleotide-diphospho-sugar transferase domain-containing protein n=1 Tax=Phytophthora fragariae TaxID=53985 RepID=A0A6A3Y8R1_9STRA|nr:hypothetical protein PF003_g29591 [Phytophthora fragariae]KAE8937223.1 hypothetical protein PF009_g12862 [Phytophthora fragariae]KAE9115666.1 hypothetical protein PF007_g9933 [Phytophthora fragariae]KAE9144170.1 hypothetical protein PF006_g10861 [Phytophthora fragariae]KAE9214175.1 hypothetical protein PF005_g9927 [Phytophthora fragariae]
MEWRSSACTKVSARDASASSPRRSSAGRWLLYLLLLSVASSSSLLLVWSSAPLSPFRSPLNGSELTQTGKLSALPMGDTVERNLRCIGWRATLDCTPFGPRDPLRDQPCGRTVGDSGAGYCEVEDADTGEHFRVMRRHCTSLFHAVRLRCDDALAFVDFRVKARKAVAKALAPGFALPNVVDGGGKTPRDGVVIVVYPRLVASAYALIRTLRETGSKLPIQLWYCPQELYSFPGPLTPLQHLADSDPELSFHKIDDTRAMGFGAKVYSIYHSTLDRVLFLDADNFPVRDPTSLFNSAEFERTGAVFWPDYWHPKHSIFNIHEKSMLWELLDMPYADMFEQESGQLLIDRRRHAAPMKLAFFYMFHRPNFFQKLQVAHGDKDLFRFAWLKLEAPFHMILTPPAVAGKVVDDLFCGMTMAQHDLEGDVLFLHRNQFKLTGKLAGLKKERCQRPMDFPTWLSGRTCCLSTARLKSSTT